MVVILFLAKNSRVRCARVHCPDAGPTRSPPTIRVVHVAHVHADASGPQHRILH